MSDRRSVLRAPTGPIGLVGVAVLVLFLLGDVVVRGSWGQALLVAPWLLIPVWLVHVFWFAPHVAARDDGVRVHNVLRVVDLPWQAVEEIRMRWQLEFHLTDAARTRDGRRIGGRDGIVQAWAVTARRHLSARAREATERSDAETLDVLRGLRASAGARPDARVTRSWDVPTLVAGAVIAAACVASYVVAG